MARKQVGAIDAELLGRVDVARGDVPRTRFVERALEAALGSRGGPSAASGGDEAVPTGGRAPASPRASDVDRLREEVERFEPDLRALAETAPVARSSGLFACPEPLCLKKGEKGEPCPVHEVPMTFKL